MWSFFFFFHSMDVFVARLGIGAQLWCNRSHWMDPDARGLIDRVNFAHRRACEISSPSCQGTACVSECSDRPRNIAFVENCDSTSRFATCSPRTKLKRDILTQRRRQGALHRARLMNIKTANGKLKFDQRKIDVATCLPLEDKGFVKFLPRRAVKSHFN